MPSLRRSPRGFTLIELLIVIAIIAILTAILLPVFLIARENARQSTSMSNMKDIEQKMEQFKLDNHRYPDVLFGYAIPGGYTDSSTTLLNALSKAQAYDDAYNKAHPTNPNSIQAKLAFPGLYPAYINDPTEFMDPDNLRDQNSPANQQVASQLATNIILPCNATYDMTLNGTSGSSCTGAGSGSVVSTYRSFYTLDAYDASPIVGPGPNNITGTFTTRYQTAREGLVCTAVNTPPGCAPNDSNYVRQLRWQNPPANTVVTATTYHVRGADRVLVLFLNGSVKKMTGEDFANLEGGGNFWTATP